MKWRNTGSLWKPLHHAYVFILNNFSKWGIQCEFMNTIILIFNFQVTVRYDDNKDGTFGVEISMIEGV